MAKKRRRYVCQECGVSAGNWLGKCPSCGAWNSYVEEAVHEEVAAPLSTSVLSLVPDGVPTPVSEISLASEPRLLTGAGELDRVLGGGIVPGSVVLLAGDPGIGKSTLLTVLGLTLPETRILYVTGEESLRQVKMRAQRLGAEGDSMHVLAQTNVESVIGATLELEPEILIVDSIQTLFRPDLQSAPGSVTQVRESAAALLQMAKSVEIPVFLVGHVTKSGAIAGPRVLEHMVDTVLYLEGDRHHAFRILRAVKNRFGSTNEIGVFEMTSAGVREVLNPSEVLLTQRTTDTSGTAVVCALEGTRPVLIEIQALVAPTSYATPQRTATGFDGRRLQMLLAVLERRVGLRLSAQDVFVNVAGGVRLDDPAADLGVVVALASSFRDLAVDRQALFVGEVGLGGEVRAVTQLEARLREGGKLGFRRGFVPSANLSSGAVSAPIAATGLDSVSQIVDRVLQVKAPAR